MPAQSPLAPRSITEQQYPMKSLEAVFLYSVASVSFRNKMNLSGLSDCIEYLRVNGSGFHTGPRGCGPASVSPLGSSVWWTSDNTSEG